MGPDRPTVLVVDDERLIRWSLEQSLGVSFHVLTAATAEEALRLLGRRRVDALVTDLSLPAMSGIELLRIVRRRHPHVKQFVITAEDSRETAEELRADGVIGIVGKPFDLERITDLLRRHVGPAVTPERETSAGSAGRSPRAS